MANDVAFQHTTPATPPSGTVVAADEISEVIYQRVKIALGAAGVSDGDVNTTNPMPTMGVLANTSAYWLDQRLDYTSGDLDYRGVNVGHKAGTGTNTWYVWKYTWNGSGACTRIEGPLVGSWDNRASLAWA